MFWTDKTRKHLTQELWQCRALLGHGGEEGRVGFQGLWGGSPSSVMVPLLEPPLLLDCRRDEEDTEDSAARPLGEGEGVRVGEVLLEVVEVPDGGLLLVSSFC